MLNFEVACRLCRCAFGQFWCLAIVSWTGQECKVVTRSTTSIIRPGACFSKVPKFFGWHNSLCIFKTKVFRVTKLRSYFNFYSLYNIWKDHLYKVSGSECYEWLFGPVKFSGLLGNARLEWSKFFKNSHSNLKILRIFSSCFVLFEEFFKKAAMSLSSLVVHSSSWFVIYWLVYC